MRRGKHDNKNHQTDSRITRHTQTGRQTDKKARGQLRSRYGKIVFTDCQLRTCSRDIM